MGGKPITQVQKACYLGVWLETGLKSNWREQYKVKAGKAATVTNVLLGLDCFVGKIPAWDARTLYMARVDPYLTARCDVCLDMDIKSLALLERVQLKFLRRMLGLGRRSMKAVLFSETGIWPIKYRRAFLALKYLCYLLQLDPKRPAANSLQESLALAYQQRLCWINDLRIVLSRLHVPVNLDISRGFGVKEVEIAMKGVEKSMELWIDDEIQSSSRVRDILPDRKKMDTKTNTLVKKSLDFRHYLRIASPENRRALTKMVLSGHSLATRCRRK
ncbi:hypothetical protein B0H19DRAFT_1067729 [Mycena capillaripes]|nr:hypothetical protein B0H19DRAFT_1067729 [Mycena capillaripes]